MSSNTVRIGVLAFQGAFAEHEQSLQAVFEQHQDGLFKDWTLDVQKIRRPGDVVALDGLILPGGESTTMGKFLERNKFSDLLTDWIQGNGSGQRWVWGTCAGLILLADRLEDVKKGGQFKLGGLNITSARNMYGRQTESFEAPLELFKEELAGDQGEKSYHGVFIRAPGIKSVDGPEVEVLARCQCGGESRVVAVQQGKLIATAFHPELTNDLRWHLYFLRSIIRDKAAAMAR